MPLATSFANVSQVRFFYSHLKKFSFKKKDVNKRRKAASCSNWKLGQVLPHGSYFLQYIHISVYIEKYGYFGFFSKNLNIFENNILYQIYIGMFKYGCMYVYICFYICFFTFRENEYHGVKLSRKLFER